MSEAEAASASPPAEATAVENEGGEETPTSASANPLTPELIGENLSQLCKTCNGVAHAYVRLDVPEKELTDIEALKTFKHLRYMDISSNKLTDISPISSLPEVLVINGSSNELESLSSLSERRYLQVVNFSSNKLTAIDGLNFQHIEIMNLANNEIASVSKFKCDALSQLRVLDLSGNKLEDTDGILVPSLESLYLGKNQLASLSDVVGLKNLETLNVRNNKLETLADLADGHPKLKYLNLRENNITNKEEVFKLANLTALETLILTDNPVREMDDYRMEVLVQIPSLLRLDKEAYTPAELQEAQQIRQERQAELEAERQSEEAAEE